MFDWSEYLALARTLRTSSDEAAWRSSISRAYYAAFHAGRRHVTEKWGAKRLTGRGDDHALVWDILTGERDATRQERGTGSAGRRLKVLRTEADYRDAIVRPQENATMAVGEADRIIALLG